MLNLFLTLLLKCVHHDPLGNYQTYRLLKLEIKSVCGALQLLRTVGLVVYYVMLEEAIHNIDLSVVDVLGDSF